MKLVKIVNAYKVLGEATTSKISEEEILKIVKIRKAMRPHSEEFEAYLKDCQEKFKPENWNSIEEKSRKWDSLSEEDKISVNKELIAYQKKINDAILEEQEKDIELSFDKVSENTILSIGKENGWNFSKIEELIDTIV